MQGSLSQEAESPTEGVTGAGEETPSNAGASAWRPGISAWCRHGYRTVLGSASKAVLVH